MIDKIKDKQYLLLVDHILTNRDFKQTADSFHHGTNRYEHCIKVSYISYMIARKLGLDFESTATAGLLHDFFTTDNNKTFVGSIKSLFKHSKIASNNATNCFIVSEKEKNIIETHMFPINIKPPKYTEGWIVSIVDKLVGTFEFSSKFKYVATVWALFLFNVLK